jgi:hypothetical protein
VKDFLGVELSIDDEVVVTRKNYRGFVKAKIIGSTDQKVRLSYMNTWNYGSPGKEETYLVYANEVVKI